MNVITVSDLKKNFGSLQVLKGVSFDVPKGEVLSVIGPSGSGKSTLLRCINQLEKVDSGTISVCGQTMVTNGHKGEAQYSPKEVLREIQLKVGLVFQNFNLFPHLSVLENITLAQKIVLGKEKPEAEETAYKLLKKMSLEDKALVYPFSLSGGQQQRVSIARALALNPEVLFFDEPTSALDPELTGEILKVIRNLAEEKMTMVVVTHEMIFARDVSDKIIFMDNGIILEEGSGKEVIDNPKNERTRAFLNRFTN